MQWVNHLKTQRNISPILRRLVGSWDKLHSTRTNCHRATKTEAPLKLSLHHFNFQIHIQVHQPWTEKKNTAIEDIRTYYSVNKKLNKTCHNLYYQLKKWISTVITRGFLYFQSILSIYHLYRCGFKGFYLSQTEMYKISKDCLSVADHIQLSQSEWIG